MSEAVWSDPPKWAAGLVPYYEHDARPLVPPTDYAEFVASKLAMKVPTGIADPGPLDYPARPLFRFQDALVRWLLRRGRGAIFANTGLGKTAMQATFADQVCRVTGGDFLIVSPLAVAHQTVRDADEMGIRVRYCRGLDETLPGITITNYDMLKAFAEKRWAGVALDESSLLKNETGKTRLRIQEMFRGVPFKGSFSATPAPNDFTELGTQAEFLEVCTMSEMLATYFVHDGGSTQDWRLKGHAQEAFWRWVASWAALMTHPRDIGFDDIGYDLPPLRVEQHVIPATEEDRAATQGAGQLTLFAQPAATLQEQRAARRITMPRRVQGVADLVALEPDEAWLIWCDLNDEADALEELIENSVQVAGADPPAHKESAAVWFPGLIDGLEHKRLKGRRRILISKSSIFGFGLNFQNCARVAFVGPTHKWESVFQAIRRCYRFGQTREVHVHIFSSELESKVLENFWRKEREAAELTARLRELVGAYVRQEIDGAQGPARVDLGLHDGVAPSWLVTLPGDPTPPQRFAAPDPDGRLGCSPIHIGAPVFEAEPPAWLSTVGGA
jgi:hypothetical protein